MSFLLCKAFVGLPHRGPGWSLGNTLYDIYLTMVVTTGRIPL